MLPSALENMLLYDLFRKLIVAVPNPYRTDLFLLLAASKSVPNFALEIVPLLCCNLFSEKWKLSPSLALSQSLNLSWKE
jgi:hypothetical protein